MTSGCSADINRGWWRQGVCRNDAGVRERVASMPVETPVVSESALVCAGVEWNRR